MGPPTGWAPAGPGLIHHSDAGKQYIWVRYAKRLADAGALASIGTVGDSYDNALAESVIGLYKTECVKIDGLFRTVDELERSSNLLVRSSGVGRTRLAPQRC